MKRFTTAALAIVTTLLIALVSLAAYNYSIDANGFLGWTGRSRIWAPANSKVQFCNNTKTQCLTADVTANGAVSFFALNGTTAATVTAHHYVFNAAACADLPATSTTKHVYLVSDSGAGDKAGLCVPDPTGWLLADGSAVCCP